jgi:3-hydroxyisobutyrate dehydrogenase
MTSIAFLGLGVMGAGMAGRLLSAGFPVAVWNRSADRAKPLADAGARVATSPRDAAANADVTISMVADDAAARSVWMGDDGALAGGKEGAILIESSTVSPEWIAELATAAQAQHCVVLDAPVTGSRVQAASGELLFLVGGGSAAVDRVRPVLAPMSRDVLHVGPLGSGARLKLINNFICGAQAAALAEGIALAEKSGLNLDAALTVLQNGAPGSPLVKAVSTRMASRDYTVFFKLALMRKDLDYAATEAAHHGLDLTTAKNARTLFDRAIEKWGESDFSAVVESLRPSNGATR